MKAKIATIIGLVLCLNMALQAMVLHNYCEDKKESIRTEKGIFNEDYLFLGNELNFSGGAEDLLFLGKRLTFDGTTKLGLLSLCDKLIYSGMSGNGIIAGGREIVVNGTINGNSYIGCKKFAMSGKAEVNGNLFIACAKLIINGKLDGDLYACAGDIIINNEIHGNVTVYGGRIIIGERGKIDGNLHYSTKEKLNEKELAKVAGEVTIDKEFSFNVETPPFNRYSRLFEFLFGFGMFVSFVIIGSSLLFLPVFKKLDMRQPAKAFWKTSLWGLIPIFMYPALIVLNTVLIITIPFAVVLLLAFFPLFFIANIIGATLVGKYLVTKFGWNVQKRHYQFLVGALAGAIISLVPFVGCLFGIFVCALGWGVYISFLFNKDMTVEEKKTGR